MCSSNESVVMFVRVRLTICVWFVSQFCAYMAFDLCCTNMYRVVGQKHPIATYVRGRSTLIVCVLDVYDFLAARLRCIVHETLLKRDKVKKTDGRLRRISGRNCVTGRYMQ